MNLGIEGKIVLIKCASRGIIDHRCPSFQINQQI
jgi:hypothetical protein